MFDQQYEVQVRLLLRCLSVISKHTCFALKGGTAINLFLRDLPRISVDIDLAYLPLNPRPEALKEIHEALLSMKEEVKKHIPDSQVKKSASRISSQSFMYPRKMRQSRLSLI